MTPEAGRAEPRREEAGPRPGGAPALRHAAWIPALLYMGLIFYLSSLSDPLPDLTFRVWDKALHAIEYAALGAMLLVALRASGAAAATALVLAMAGASLYGASDEIHQYFVPGRQCDLRDWLADTVGALLGAALAAASLRAWWARASIRAARRRT